MNFEADSSVPVDSVTLDLLEDGMPALPITVPGQDMRLVRVLGFKAQIEGVFTLQLTATDHNGCSATYTSPVKVTVVK